MPQGRPDIPRPLERAVKVEAGHRCAIPTCRTIPVQIAHIVPYQQVREHKFENLIALCPTCHARQERGDIDRQSMIQYKANLTILAGRYGDIERRVLRVFAGDPTATYMDQPGALQILFYYLLEDGLLKYGGMAPWATQIQGVNTHDRYFLTAKGRDFIGRWMAAQPLE